MIIDGHAHIADTEDTGGFRTPHINAEDLLSLMDGPFGIGGRERKVDLALVQPMISPTRSGSPESHHRYVADAVGRYPDRLVGCFVANPLLDIEETVQTLKQHVASGRFRAVKLHPVGHGYHLVKLRDRLTPILEEVESIGIPVIVHQGDAPFGHPSHLAVLSEEFPGVRFIIAHFARQRIVMSDEAIYVATQNENVFLETGWGDLPRIKEGLAVLPVDRFVFGSDCPVLEIGSQLRVLEVLGWTPPLGIALSDREVEAMLGDNMAKLIGL